MRDSKYLQRESELRHRLDRAMAACHAVKKESARLTQIAQDAGMGSSDGGCALRRALAMESTASEEFMRALREWCDFTQDQHQDAGSGGSAHH